MTWSGPKTYDVTDTQKKCLKECLSFAYMPSSIDYHLIWLIDGI